MAYRRKSPMVGKEGLVGVSLIMGGATTPRRAIVQSAGHALPNDGTAAQGRV